MSALLDDAADVQSPRSPIVGLTSAGHSESIGKIAAALAKAQGQIENAAKDSLNPHFKAKYADLASVWDACRKPLSSNELALLQPVSSEGVIVHITTLLVHSSGEYIAERLTMKAPSDTPQGVGAAITYGRRYGLSAMVGIAPEDDDAEAAMQTSRADNTTAPKGYDDWLDDMRSTADNGEAALTKAWSASRPEFRRHLTQTDPATWATIKAKSKTAAKPAPAGGDA